MASILKLVAVGRAPIVVVPGGGTFADAVRKAQSELKFSDAAAHRMAMLAMHQMGLLLADLNPRLVPVETLASLRRAIAGAKVPVWLPLKLAAGDKRIPADWSVTSDGLAARLAERLRGATVVLVKSCQVPPGATLAGLVQMGVVDPTFAAIVERAHLPWRVLGAGREGELAELLSAETGRTDLLRDPGRREAPAHAIARRR